ncbi:hypothetical protein IAR50_003871 [Cryptococcus sp. DSM 104548]
MSLSPSQFSQEEKEKGINTLVNYTSTGIKNRARALIEVNRGKQRVDDTISASSQLAIIKLTDGIPLADPEEDYKVLTLDDAELLLLLAGRKRPGEPIDDEKEIGHYRNWDAKTANQWS